MKLDDTSSRHMYCQCPRTAHWTCSLNCEPLLLHTTLHGDVIIQTEGQSYPSRVNNSSTAYSYVCVYLCWQSCARVCGLRLSGSSNQPLDKGSHCFGIIRLQVAKQPLFNHRKQNMRVWERLLMIISVCMWGMNPEAAVHLYLRPTTIRYIPDVFVPFKCRFTVCEQASVRGEWCSWREVASSECDPLKKQADWGLSISVMCMRVWEHAVFKQMLDVVIQHKNRFQGLLCWHSTRLAYIVQLYIFLLADELTSRWHISFS